jgi:hypothetical protein
LGKRDAKKTVDYVPHACHQKFDNLKKAEEAGRILRETAASVRYDPPTSKPRRRQGGAGSLASKDVMSDLAALMKGSHLSGDLEIKNEVGLGSA